jgi:hypothetical protein
MCSVDRPGGQAIGLRGSWNGLSQAERSLPMDLAQFIKNRSAVPLEELEKYVGKYVAWSPDGTKILAADEAPIHLHATIKALGYDPGEIVISSVPPSDLVILGAGGFAE